MKTADTIGDTPPEGIEKGHMIEEITLGINERTEMRTVDQAIWVEVIEGAGNLVIADQAVLDLVGGERKFIPQFCQYQIIASANQSLKALVVAAEE